MAQQQSQPQAEGHWRTFVASDTVVAADLQGEHHIVVIEKVVKATIADHNDPKIKKGVLNVYFRGRRKPLICKAEKCSIISKLAGSSNCKDWIGVAIEIYPTTIRAYGETHDYIDISPKRPTAAAAKAAGARPPEPEPPPSDFAHGEVREGDQPIGGPPSADEQREIAAREASEARRG